MMKNILILSAAILSAVSCCAKSGAEIIRENNFKPEVAPLLTTNWSQDGGENALLPMVGDNRALTGCGATAVGQIMKYWSYPASGTGQNFYVWADTDGTQYVRYADFAESTYDWDNMIPLYKGNDSVTDRQINAVGRLMVDLGIALEMNYKDNSTGTNIEYISTVLKKHFGYNTSMSIHRYITGAYTMDEWRAIIYAELSAGRPVLLGGAYKGSNHLFVADGYDSEGKVHLNLGKADYGSSFNRNGYYDLTLTGQTYTENQKMLTGICPDELPAVTPEFNVTKPGTLKETLGGEKESRKLCRVRITGTLDNTDIDWLRELSAITTGQLAYIDLGDAVMTGNVLPDNAFDTSYTLQEIILPRTLAAIPLRAFRRCVGLWHVDIPAALTEIGNYAFTHCRYLENVQLPDNLGKIGINPFTYTKLENFELSSDNKAYTMVNNALLAADGTKLYSMPVITLGAYDVPDGVRSVESYAFVYQNMMTTVTLPATVTALKTYAFYECLGLRHIHLQGAVPPTLGATNCFDPTVYDNCTVHVPQGSKAAYMASDWNRFANIVEDDTPTAVADVESDVAPSTPQWYDLQGRPVRNPAAGRLYIVRSRGTATKTIVR